MARYVTTVRTPWTPEAAFAYMADLRHFAQWDPGVTKAEQAVGNGAGPGAEFDVTVRNGGVGMTLRYRTVSFNAPHHVLVVASTPLLTSEDRITVVPESDGGASVTYDADLRLSGPLRLFDPALGVAFGRIGDRAAAGMRAALNAATPVR